MGLIQSVYPLCLLLCTLLHLSFPLCCGLLNPHCYLKHTHINTYGRTRPAVQNLVLCLEGSDPTCHVGAAQAPPPPQQGSRAGSVTLVSWRHTVPPTAYCLLGKIKKLGGEKTLGWIRAGLVRRGCCSSVTDTAAYVILYARRATVVGEWRDGATMRQK